MVGEKYLKFCFQLKSCFSVVLRSIGPVKDIQYLKIRERYCTKMGTEVVFQSKKLMLLIMEIHQRSMLFQHAANAAHNFESGPC